MKKAWVDCGDIRHGSIAESWAGTITDANCGASKHADASEKIAGLKNGQKLRESAAHPPCSLLATRSSNSTTASKAMIADHVGQKGCRSPAT